MMDDLISREALRDALTALKGVGKAYVWDPEKVLEALEKAPSAVVRCVECVHYCQVDSSGGRGNGPWGSCRKLGTTWKAIYGDDFCSYGERRQDDGKAAD